MNRVDFDQWIAHISQYHGLFMTGTDTGVGKTWIGTRLLQRLSALGIKISARKPVESGWPAEQLTDTDSWKLAIANSGFQPLDWVCAYRLAAPLSPPRAASLEGKTLSVQTLAAHCKATKKAPFLYVEGAGGFYSPVAHDGLNADLAQLLNLPIIIVSEDRVGCINHILLTIQAAEQRQLKIAGIILNPMQAATHGMDNLTDLEKLTHWPVLRWPMQS